MSTKGFRRRCQSVARDAGWRSRHDGRAGCPSDAVESAPTARAGCVPTGAARSHRSQPRDDQRGLVRHRRTRRHLAGAAPGRRSLPQAEIVARVVDRQMLGLRHWVRVWGGAAPPNPRNQRIKRRSKTRMIDHEPPRTARTERAIDFGRSKEEGRPEKSTLHAPGSLLMGAGGGPVVADQ